MITLKDDYADVISRFLRRDISVDAFEFEYLEKFKTESRYMTDDEYQILDALFADIDSYTEDPVLINQESSPYLTEAQLRERANQALNELNELQGPASLHPS